MTLPLLFVFNLRTERFFIISLLLAHTCSHLQRTMSSRYDSRTTTYSPEGRLFQVEYAVEAIQQAGTVIGILTKDGIVFAAEKRTDHALFDSEGEQLRNVGGEKAFKIAEHIGCCVAGNAPDANALIDLARLVAARHTYAFQEAIAVEDLCRAICDEKQLYTQYGGVRPFGVSFLIAGWDAYFGFQLYATEPSGDYNAWSAVAIGSNDHLAQSLLKKEWRSDLSLEEAKVLGLRVLGKTLDSVKIPLHRVEVAVLRRVAAPRAQQLLNPYARTPKETPEFLILSEAELKPLVEEAERRQAEEEAAEAEKELKREQKLGGGGA